MLRMVHLTHQRSHRRFAPRFRLGRIRFPPRKFACAQDDISTDVCHINSCKHLLDKLQFVLKNKLFILVFLSSEC